MVCFMISQLLFYIYIYIYICHSQRDYFVVSQLFSVARDARCFNVGPNPADFLSLRYLTPELLSISV